MLLCCSAALLVRSLRAVLGIKQGKLQRVASEPGYGVESVRTPVNQADIDHGVGRSGCGRPGRTRRRRGTGISRSGRSQGSRGGAPRALTGPSTIALHVDHPIVETRETTQTGTQLGSAEQ